MLLWPQQYKDKHVLIWEHQKKMEEKSKYNSVSLVLHKLSILQITVTEEPAKTHGQRKQHPPEKATQVPSLFETLHGTEEPLQPTIYSAQYTGHSTRDESWPTCPPNHQQLPHKPSSVLFLWGTWTGTWGPWTPSASAGLPGILSALSSPHKPKQSTPTTPGAHKHAGEQPQIHLTKAASWICLCWSEGR